MTAAAKKLLEEIQALPPHEQSKLALEVGRGLPYGEQLELADALMQQAQPVELEPEFHATMKSRIQELEDGKVEPLSQESVEAMMRTALGDR